MTFFMLLAGINFALHYQMLRGNYKTVIKDDECSYSVPGNGDRIFGMTQDWEMSFFIPPSKVDDLLEGLAKTHKAGVRYPAGGCTVPDPA